MAMISIFSAKQFRLTPKQFDQLYEIINHAYAETEKVMWGEGYVRITKEEFQKFINADQILFALMDGQVVGGIRYFRLRSTVWSFSLLGADFNHSGKGIGRALVERVEELIKKNGGTQVHIEVLRPVNETVEAKEVIKNWYQRMDYQLVKEIPLDELYPEKLEILQTPSIFDCYLKEF